MIEWSQWNHFYRGNFHQHKLLYHQHWIVLDRPWSMSIPSKVALSSLRLNITSFRYHPEFDQWTRYRNLVWFDQDRSLTKHGPWFWTRSWLYSSRRWRVHGHASWSCNYTQRRSWSQMRYYHGGRVNALWWWWCSLRQRSKTCFWNCRSCNYYPLRRPATMYTACTVTTLSFSFTSIIMHKVITTDQVGLKKSSKWRLQISKVTH